MNSESSSLCYCRFSTAVRINVDSRARLVESELVRARDNATETVSSLFSVSEARLELAPGRGVMCGAVECHKYSSCSVHFGEEDRPACVCPEGFQGDGVTSCEPGEDCRRGGCHQAADCQYQPSQGAFACVCREGYQGDGQTCDRQQDLSSVSWNTYEDNNYPSYNDFLSSTVRPWAGPLVTTVGSSGAQYQCRREEDCHEKASCQYEHQSRKYMCRCDKWYEGDGWTSCVPGPSAGCNVLHDCHPHADCLFSEANDQHFCR